MHPIGHDTAGQGAVGHLALEAAGRRDGVDGHVRRQLRRMGRRPHDRGGGTAHPDGQRAGGRAVGEGEPQDRRDGQWSHEAGDEHRAVAQPAAQLVEGDDAGQVPHSSPVTTAETTVVQHDHAGARGPRRRRPSRRRGRPMGPGGSRDLPGHRPVRTRRRGRARTPSRTWSSSSSSTWSTSRLCRAAPVIHGGIRTGPRWGCSPSGPRCGPTGWACRPVDSSASIGLDLRVRGLDAVDGTPVLDVKPYVREFEPTASEVRQPAWASELMAQYW